jgi:hypothetical protein
MTFLLPTEARPSHDCISFGHVSFVTLSSIAR